MSGRHGGRGGRRGRGQVITDPRFARVHTDARFQVFPSKQRTVEIDERFEGTPPLAHWSLSGASCASCCFQCIRHSKHTCVVVSPVQAEHSSAGLFKDKDFQVRAPVDKRGRKVRSVGVLFHNWSEACALAFLP